MLSRLEDVDLKELSEIYDVKDSFLSLYLNLEHGVDEKFMERRKRACRKALRYDREMLDAFEENIESAERFLKAMPTEKKRKGVAIFSSKPNEFFKAYELPVSLENLLVVDTSPYIRPLARLRDELEPFGIVLLDSHCVKMYVIDSGIVQEQKEFCRAIMNKHKKGGFSQMRFQRLRRGAIEHFYREVAEDFEGFLKTDRINKVILGGPGESKVHFKDFLPERLRSGIVGIVDVDFDVSMDRLIKGSIEIVMESEQKESRLAVESLKTEILKDGLAVYGLSETLNAVRSGSAEQLIVLKGHKVKGWICENCQVVESGRRRDCPNCGSITSDVDVVEEIIEFAERMGTKIEFVDDNEFLREIGGVGALLRYK